jgi:hypothetical protein
MRSAVLKAGVGAALRKVDELVAWWCGVCYSHASRRRQDLAVMKTTLSLVAVVRFGCSVSLQVPDADEVTRTCRGDRAPLSWAETVGIIVRHCRCGLARADTVVAPCHTVLLLARKRTFYKFFEGL